MTNNLKELDNILEECPSCKGDGFTAEHEDGCDGNCNFCPVQVQCDHCHAKGYYVDKQDVLTLINQKEKESRLEENKRYEEWFNNDENTHIEDFIERRIKQLKEELEEKQL